MTEEEEKLEDRNGIDLDGDLDGHSAEGTSLFQCLHSVFDSLMVSRCSSLPEEWTKFISIMASSRFLKQSLVEEAKEELRSLRVRSKHVMQWLNKGLSAVPPKLKALSELNIMLAHHPWKVTAASFAELAALNWSNSEALHATLVLCFFHSFCTIVISKDISLDTLVETSSQMTAKIKEVAFEVPLVDEMESKRGINCSESPLTCNAGNHKTLLQYFRRMRSKSATEIKTREFVTEASKFVTDNLETQYSDFKPRRTEKSSREFERGRIGCMFGVSRYEGTESSTPKVHQPYNLFEQFNWETDGYSLVSSLLPSTNSKSGAKSVASSFDDLIKSTSTLQLFSDEFKDHIWNYVHILFGIQFQDFDHENVNKVLKVDLKLFVKAAACYPDRITDTLINESLKCFSKHERFAINLLVCIARLHVSLLYSLKAFYDHQCNESDCLED